MDDSRTITAQMRAREVLRSEPLDAIFLDLVLAQNRSAGPLLVEIKSSTRTPVTILTALDRSDPEVVTTLALGADHYLQKPIRLEGVKEALRAMGIPA